MVVSHDFRDDEHAAVGETKRRRTTSRCSSFPRSAVSAVRMQPPASRLKNLPIRLTVFAPILRTTTSSRSHWPQIAAAVSLSPSYLSHLFCRAAGCSPMQYVAHLRLGRAQVLLIQTGMPVSDIAFSVGYNNVGSFNYAFLKFAGCSPTVFRPYLRLPCGYRAESRQDKACALRCARLAALPAI
jgi:AraC-like DNA-binding protein